MLPLIAKASNKLVSDTKVLVDEAGGGLQVIRKHDKVRLVRQVKESYRSLSKTTEAVHTYLDKINGLYRLLNEQIPGAIEDIESGRLKSTDQLAVEINRILQDSTRDYEILDGCFEEFTTNCNNAQRELRRLKEEAESNQRTAAMAAGTAAAGGLAASAIVGLFTFGIGAAVGAAITAGATAAATTVAAVLVVAYGDTAELFGTIDGRLGNLQYREIHGLMKEISLTMNNKRLTLNERTDLAMKMRSTLEQSKRLHSETCSGLKITDEVKRAFANKVYNAF